MKLKDYKMFIILLMILFLITIFGWIDSQRWASKFGTELITTDIELLQCQEELKSAYQLLLKYNENR